MHPGRTIFALQHTIGLFIADHLLLFGIPLERSSECKRVVGQNARRGRDVALLDIRDGPAAGINCVQKIQHVIADSGRDMALEILFGPINRILLEFVGDVTMNHWSAARRRKLVAEHVGFERAFVAVEGCTPLALRIGRAQRQNWMLILREYAAAEKQERENRPDTSPHLKMSLS